MFKINATFSIHKFSFVQLEIDDGYDVLSHFRLFSRTAYAQYSMLIILFVIALQFTNSVFFCLCFEARFINSQYQCKRNLLN